MPDDINTNDTGPASVAGSGSTSARDVAGQNVINVNPPPDGGGGDRQGWLVETAYRTAQDVAHIRAQTAEIREDQACLGKTVQHHSEVLFGNGDERVGLVSRVRSTWGWIPLMVAGIIINSALIAVIFAILMLGGVI